MSRRSRNRTAPREPTPPPPPPQEPAFQPFAGIDFGDNIAALELHQHHIESQKIVTRGVTISSTLLDELEILNDVLDPLNYCGLTYLIDSTIPTNERLVYEFLASFGCAPSKGKVDEVKFRLGNQDWTFSHSAFAEILGFPTDCIYPEFDELDRHETWQEFGVPGTVYYPSIPASQIAGGSIRIVHRLLAYSLFDRYEKGTKVTTEEMDFLVGLCHNDYVDTTSVLCHRFADWADKERRHKILGGGLFIWKIATHLGVAPADSLPPIPINRKDLERGHILRRNERCRWINRVDPEPRAEQRIAAILIRVEELRRARAGADADADDDLQHDIPAHASGTSYQPPPSDFGERLTAIETTQRAILTSQRTLEAYLRHSDAQLRVDRAHQRAMNRWISNTLMYVQDDTAWAPPPPSPDYPDPFQWPGSSSAPGGPDDHSTA